MGDFFTLLEKIWGVISSFKAERKREKKFKTDIKKLTDIEKSILREFVMQSNNYEEKEYIKLPDDEDNVCNLLDKNFLVKNSHKTGKIILCKKSDLAKKILTNIDIGFPQKKITPEIKKEFKGKRPSWIYPKPPQKFGIIRNVYGSDWRKPQF